MARFVSLIGSRRDGKVEFTLINENKHEDCFASLMSPDEAFRMAKKLVEAAETAMRHIDDYDISGDHARAYREVRDKYKVFNGQRSK